MKICNLPPDAPAMMWATRAIGYTTEAAVADLIDNSVTAEAGAIQIKFSSFENGYISILDDGNGLTNAELKLAMKYGSANPLEERSDLDLGRFGLGLKTASLSQCRQLTVASKKNNIVSAFRWDLDYVMYTAKDWTLLELEESDILDIPQIDKLTQQSEGTLILWRNLDKICAGQEDKEEGLQIKVCDVMDHLALTFHRYLQGEQGLKKLSIICNGNELQPKDPFFVAKSTRMFAEPVTLKVKKGVTEIQEQIIITPYILPFPDMLTQQEIDTLGGKDGLIKNQGFYIYRNKRLIVAADWFKLARKTDLTKLCRVRVDIPNSMDEEWTLDVKKSTAIPPSIIVQNLKRIISKILNKGKRTYRFRAKKETSSNIKLWVAGETRNGVVYTINRNYPLIATLLRKMDDDKTLDIVLKLVEQNIPLNTIHSDFHDDKKFAYDDCEVAENNILQQLKELMAQVEEKDKRETFDMLMTMSPFDAYEILYEEVDK
ncbi:MAG: ATP-binding protein [Christensenellaceae bacterium]